MQMLPVVLLMSCLGLGSNLGRCVAIVAGLFCLLNLGQFLSLSLSHDLDVFEEFRQVTLYILSQIGFDCFSLIIIFRL